MQNLRESFLHLKIIRITTENGFATKSQADDFGNKLSEYFNILD